MKRVRNRFSSVCCVRCALLIALFGALNCVSAQKASSPLAFEVETIKPTACDPTRPFNTCDFSKHWVHTYPGRVTYGAMRLKDLVAVAYEINQFQISGPDWMNTEYFDIEAKIPEGAANEDVPKMLQELLKRRFNLAFHIEKREGRAYALVVGKHGANLKPPLPDSPVSDPDAPPKPGERWVGEGDARQKQTTNKDGSTTFDMGKRGTLTMKFDPQTMTEHWEQSKITMEEFAGYLQAIMPSAEGRSGKVVDRTGIKGEYQVAIDYPLGSAVRQNASGDGGASDPQDSGSLNRSLDALGLRLEIEKAPIDNYVVDHVEKPSEN